MKYIHVAIYNSTMDTFGKRERQNPDWFEEGIAELEPVITAKRAVLVEYKRDLSEKSLAAFRKARNDVSGLLDAAPMTVGWTFSRVFNSTVCGNIHAMYDGMKKPFGPNATKITPLKSTTGDIITDWGKQMERWAEHYQELYLRENTVTDSAVKSTYALPILEELDVPPSVEELSKAIDSLACGKAPGKDGIPPEVIKSGR